MRRPPYTPAWNWRIIHLTPEERQKIQRLAMQQRRRWVFLCSRPGCTNVMGCWVAFDYKAGPHQVTATTKRGYCWTHAHVLAERHGINEPGRPRLALRH